MPTATRPTRMAARTTTDVARWIPAVRVRGRSMLPALAPGRVLVTRPAWGRIGKGDVVVFATDDGRLYVKRIGAMPGDVVMLRSGRCPVPAGHCFVVGDNARESDDSRVWREPFVALSQIHGVAFLGRAFFDKTEQRPIDAAVTFSAHGARR